MDLPRIGLWTFALDLQPMTGAQEAAGELEDLGYRALWLPDAVGRDPLVNAALLCAATREMVVATGVANVYGRDAMAMNSGWQTVSEAFPGRFLLGLGVSHAPMVEGLRGQTYASPVATMRTYLDRMDAALFVAAATGEAAPPARVLAALGPRMLALAAERTLGAHTYFVPPEHTAFAREAMGPGALLAPEQMVVLETEPGAARAVARQAMGVYLGLPNYTNNLRRLGFTEDDLAGGGSDRVVDAVVVWGDEDAVRARVQQHFDAGADHVCVQVLTADPRALPMEGWRRLAPALLG